MKAVFFLLGLAGLLSVAGYSAAQDETADGNTVLNQEYAPLEKKAPVYPYVCLSSTGSKVIASSNIQ